MSGASPKDIETFLHRFRRGLASLPADIREDLVAEVRSHLNERAGQGKLDIENEFGSPERYAARFVAEEALSSALEQGSSFRLVRTLLATARDTALVVFAVIPLAILQLMALVTVGMGMAKPYYGERIGLFVGPEGHFRLLGWMSPDHFEKSERYTEVLGYAGVPIFIIGGLIVFWLCNRLFVMIARWRLVRVRPSQR